MSAVLAPAAERPAPLVVRADVLCAVVIALAMVLIYSNAPVVGVRFHGLPDVINYVAPLLLLGVAMYSTLGEGRSVRLTAAFPWLLLFLGVGFVSALNARDPDSALDDLLVILMEGVLLFLLTVNAVRGERLLNVAIWSVIAAATALAAVVAHQYLTGAFTSEYAGFGQLGSPLFDEADSNKTRLAGAIGEANRFAQILAMAIPLAGIKAVTAARRGVRQFAFVCCGVIVVGCAVTFSRGVLVGLVPVLALATLLGYVKIRSVLIGGMCVLLVLAFDPAYRQRVVSLGDAFSSLTRTDGLRGSDGATRGRYTSIGASMLAFVDHPLIGVGPGQSSAYYLENSRRVGGKVRAYPREAHSLLPEIVAEWGLVGLVGFIGLVGAIVLRLLKGARRARASGDPVLQHRVSLLLALVAYAGTSVFLHFSYIRYFWLMLGLAAVAGLVASSRSSSEVSR